METLFPTGDYIQIKIPKNEKKDSKLNFDEVLKSNGLEKIKKIMLI